MSALLGRPSCLRPAVRFVSFLTLTAAFVPVPNAAGQQLTDGPSPRRAGQPISQRSVLAMPDQFALPVGDGEPASPQPSTETVESDYGLLDLAFGSSSCDSLDGCTVCSQADCQGCDPWCLFPNCTPPGLLQWMSARHEHTNACWTGRVDALLLWRNAPQAYPLATQTAGTEYPTLNADQLDSTPAAGPRIQIFRTDSCGRTWEWAYLRGFNFRSQRVLPSLGTNSYLSGDLYGNTSLPFDEAFTNLGSGVQTFELNYRTASNRAWRWLAGFRWLEWRESFEMLTNDFTGGTTDLYQTNVFNSLYGGQIGADLTLLTLPWIRVDSVIKAGAYYNNAVQRSQYQVTTGGVTQTTSIAVDKDPASGAFVGELALNAAIPLTRRIDFRFGYEALWLASIAQPTGQLANQLLVIGQPPAGGLDTGGSVVVQGISLGLEGRW